MNTLIDDKVRQTKRVKGGYSVASNDTSECNNAPNRALTSVRTWWWLSYSKFDDDGAAGRNEARRLVTRFDQATTDRGTFAG